MAFFTDPRQNFFLQNLDMINEIVDSINARIPDGSSSALSAVAAGDVIQSWQFWQRMQSRLIGMASLFAVINGTNPWDTYSISDETINISWASIKTDTTSGYDSLWVICDLPRKLRRATDYDPATNDWTDPTDAMFITPSGDDIGYIREGDIIGPWIIEDLQRICDALTTKIASVEIDSFRYFSGSGSGSTAAAAYLDAVDDYQERTNGVNGVRAYCDLIDFGSSNWTASLVRTSSSLILSESALPDGTILKAEENGGSIFYFNRHPLSQRELIEFLGGEYNTQGDAITEEPQWTIISTKSFLGDDTEWPASGLFTDNYTVPSQSPTGVTFYGYEASDITGTNANSALIKPNMPYTIDRT
jgi:hypothetical protein